jgi:hypothetical protein
MEVVVLQDILSVVTAIAILHDIHVIVEFAVDTNGLFLNLRLSQGEKPQRVHRSFFRWASIVPNEEHPIQPLLNSFVFATIRPPNTTNINISWERVAFG